MAIPTLPDDCRLLRAWCRGDAQALADLIQRHRDMVYGLACRLTGNASDADDLCQDVFVALAKHARVVRHCAAWLATVTRHRADALCRHRNRNAGTDLTCLAAAPEEDRAGRQRMVQAAMDALSEEDRELLSLRFYANRTQEEMAGQLGLSQPTVHRRLERAMERLRQRLEPVGLGLPGLALFGPATTPETTIANLGRVALSAPAASTVSTSMIGFGLAVAILATVVLGWLVWSHRQPVGRSMAIPPADAAEEGGLIDTPVRLILRRDPPAEVAWRLGEALPAGCRLRFVLPRVRLTRTWMDGWYSHEENILRSEARPPWTTWSTSEPTPLRRVLDDLARQQGWSWKLLGDCVVMQEPADPKRLSALALELDQAACRRLPDTIHYVGNVLVDMTDEKPERRAAALRTLETSLASDQLQLGAGKKIIVENELPGPWCVRNASLEDEDQGIWALVIPHLLSAPDARTLAVRMVADCWGSAEWTWRSSVANSSFGIALKTGRSVLPLGSPLRALQTDLAIEALIRGCCEQPRSPLHRSLAAMLAGEIGYPWAGARLRTWLDGAKGLDRQMLLAGLASLGDPELRSLWLEILAEDPAEARSTLILPIATIGLRRLGPSPATAVRPELPRLAKTGTAPTDSWLRLWIASLPADCDPMVLPLLQQGDWWPLIGAGLVHRPAQGLAASSLWMAMHATPNEVTAEAVVSVIQALLRLPDAGTVLPKLVPWWQANRENLFADDDADPDWSRQDRPLVQAASWIRDPQAADILMHLAQSPTSRSLALRMLAQIRLPEAMRAMQGLCTGQVEQDPALVQAISESNEQPWEAVLLAVLPRLDATGCTAVWNGLPLHRGDDLPAAILRRILDDPDLARRLLLKPNPLCTPVILKAIRSLIDNDSIPLTSRSALLYLLANLDDPTATRCLYELGTNARHPYLRATAVHADPLLKELARERLHDSDAQVRRYAIASLWSQLAKEPVIRSVLGLATTDPTPAVRATAIVTLRLLAQRLPPVDKETPLLKGAAASALLAEIERARTQEVDPVLRRIWSEDLVRLIHSPLVELGCPGEQPVCALSLRGCGIIQAGDQGTVISCENMDFRRYDALRQPSRHEPGCRCHDRVGFTLMPPYPEGDPGLPADPFGDG